MKEKYISRVDSEKSKMYGYLLRLYKGKDVLFQQWFSDNKYGGKDKSFSAAISTRDTKISELNYYPGNGHTNREWRPVGQNRRPRSNIGHLGVYESHDFKTLKDGSKRKCSYIAASYVEDKGKPKIRKFYIGTKRTREQAIKEAIDFRKSREVSLRIAAVEYNRKLQQRLIEAENKMLAETRKSNRKRKSTSTAKA